MRILAELESPRNSGRRSGRAQSLGPKRATAISSDADRGAGVMPSFDDVTDGRRLNGVAYLRVSTDQQAESGLGLDAQRASVLQTAERLGLRMRAVYVDAAVSGALSLKARPVLVQAVSALQRGDVLLVAKRDRLGRDHIEVALIERLIGKRGARIVSAAGEGTDNEEPSNVLMRWLIDLFAEYERLIIRSRTKQALAVKRARGERMGQLPFGFQVAPDGKHLEPNAVEQDQLARILALNAEGRSTRQIAADLNRDGYTTRRGTGWRFEYIARVLRTRPRMVKADLEPRQADLFSEAAYA